MTASKLVPRKGGILGVSKLFQIDLAFPDVRLVIGVNINFWSSYFIYILFLFSVLLWGCMLVNLTRCMRYWDDLSVTQLLVRRMGHLKKIRLAE